MADRVWTAGQSAAINMRDGDLIISAAAGSGKTAVLCERVIRSLLDEKEPINISDMLIVTFTKASAEELRERIAKAIREEIVKSPDNRRLVRQLVMIQNADIGTIHSFCGNLISANTAALSLMSNVRVSDATESEVIARKTMEKCINDAYALDGEFAYMVKNFVSLSDAALADKLLEIYKDTQSSPRGIDLLYEYAREFSEMDKENWGSSRYAKQILDSLCAELKSYISTLKDGLDYIINDEKVYKARGGAYEYDISYMTKLCRAASGTWDDLMNALAEKYDPPKCTAVRGGTDSRTEEIKDDRDAVKDRLRKISSEYLWDTGAVIKICEINAKFLLTLYRTLTRFEKAFSEEKRRLSIVDFTDLERMAYKLLVDHDGRPTELAREISKKYKQIYIDEYQDTNALQDGIFAAISSANRFMVGDIKQSIYAFRGAEPSIFARYRDTFDDFTPENKDIEGGKRIFLSNNFRCDKPIIDFSNRVFEMLFRNNSGRIEYLDEDALVFSKEKKEKYERVEILLTEKDKECTGYSEAVLIANEIKKLLVRGVKPSDIAVMMRSMGENARVLKRVFEREGIPIDTSGNVDLFSVPEILFVLSLLNCIDNPHRDIWFASALSSKIFGIEFNDIVDIASEKYETRMSLYDKFRAYTDEKDFEKGKRFLSWLSEARENASGKKVFEIIEDICSNFAVSALAELDREKGGTAKRRIETFKNLARGYERSAFRGLHSFLGYVKDMRSGKIGGDALKIEGADKKDCVQLLTVHHSKGLEFEYCFVSGCAKNVNKSDIRANFLFSNSFGAVIRAVDLGGKIRYNSPMYKAMVEYIYEMQIDEEMRILYVALTRARKKLFVTAEVKGVEDTLNKALKMQRNPSPYVFRASSTYILWILAAIYQRADDVDISVGESAPYYEWKNGRGSISLRKLGGECEENADLNKSGEILITEAELDAPKAKTLELDEIRERLEYLYPYEKELTLPAKMSVSRLFPEVLDYDYVDLVKSEESFTDIPSFMSANASVKVTGAMRGTATHTFMQFCDFENAEKNGVEIELARLCDKKFIDPSLANLVYIDKLKEFFGSELYREIKSAKNIWREKRFSLMLPASEFTGREELKDSLSGAKILVQGVFDCLIEREDKTLKLIDYKTDYVSGNVEDDEKMLRERYFTQLSYYKKACELMMGRPVSETSVYSFGLGREVRII